VLSITQITTANRSAHSIFYALILIVHDQTSGDRLPVWTCSANTTRRGTHNSDRLRKDEIKPHVELRDISFLEINPSIETGPRYIHNACNEIDVHTEVSLIQRVTSFSDSSRSRCKNERQYTYYSLTHVNVLAL